MGKIHIEADANPIAAEMARLNKLVKLIPNNADIARYGLEIEEMEVISSLFGHLMFDVTPHLQMVVTVLRKRKAEKPDKPLRFADLSEFVALMTEDEQGIFTNAFLREMRKAGLIKTTRRGRVKIKI